MFRKESVENSYEIRLHLPISKDSLFKIDEYEKTTQSSTCLTLLPDNLWGFLLSPNLPVLKKLLDGCSNLNALSRVCATTTAAEADELGKTLRPFPAKGWKTLNTGTIDPFTNFWDTQPIRHQKNSIVKPILPDGSGVSKNRRDLYSTPKIIVAKMALHFEGYVDRDGEYAALNCNCISDLQSGWTLDAMAILLHSTVVAFAYKQYYDGLRMSGGYLPFQAPQLKCIPIPKITTQANKTLDLFGRILSLLSLNAEHQIQNAFFRDLADACVMECFFNDYMAKRDLLFHDILMPSLLAYESEAGETAQLNFLTKLYKTLNAPSHTIRNRMIRLTAESPELLAVIKKEGQI